MVIAMLKDANLPKSFWGYAFRTAIYVKNRLPYAGSLDPKKTPYEMWTGRKPDVSRLRVFGSKCWYHVPKELRLKLSDKARAPTRGSAHAAGYDMYASEACVVPRGGKFLVETGLSMAIPEGCCMLLPLPPSSLFYTR